MESFKERIEAAALNPQLLETKADSADAVRSVVAAVNSGSLRVAEPDAEADDGWRINGWVQQAINLYFRIAPMERIESGQLAWYDKIPPRTDHAERSLRAVPTALVRYGAFVEPGAVLMPSFINIGAYVGRGTMVDTWATVGSCAQIGRDVHLSGGVGIGGVLEPPGARPVIIEDGCFVGSRCVVVEGVHVGAEAVLGAGLVLTASTPIIDVRGATEVTLRGRIPERAVVVPGTRPKQFPAGEYLLPCALIIGERSASTDRKTSLNSALRDHGLGA
ncbi:MAG: 2,3,4,5-tetrahydropyridine-2,6-dicarboxylate N-succinyltransferase [Myxococcota bacterium]|nr:2,3,4,5-tetrahydropyridine-2,6-dicarboxylate N-succinyltransferase [Myxococcota bacterium]